MTPVSIRVSAHDCVVPRISLWANRRRAVPRRAITSAPTPECAPARPTGSPLASRPSACPTIEPRTSDQAPRIGARKGGKRGGRDDSRNMTLSGSASASCTPSVWAVPLDVIPLTGQTHFPPRVYDSRLPCVRDVFTAHFPASVPFAQIPMGASAASSFHL